MAKSMVSDRPQATGQHVTQIAFYELGAGNRLGAQRIMVGAVLPAEGDVTDVFYLWTSSPRQIFGSVPEFVFFRFSSQWMLDRSQEIEIAHDLNHAHHLSILTRTDLNRCAKFEGQP